jgi:hypothetical protein
MDVFVDFFNWVLGGLGEGLSWILGLLPRSPFADWQQDPPEEINLGYITWFIPFPTMILHFGTYLVTIGIYYLYRIIARWLKLVRS